MARSALLLDFGGVVTKTLFETHAQTEKALGLPPGTLNWQGPFAPETDDLWREMQAGDITERDYWRIRAEETGRLLGETWTQMSQFVRAARGDDPAAVLRPETEDLVRRAKRAGLRLAILSNELDLFYGAGFRKRLTFLDLFDVIHDATHTEILKPDPRAYQSCLEALDLSPGDCVFVDDQHRNVAGAEAIGLTAVLFDVRRPAQSCAEASAVLGID